MERTIRDVMTEAPVTLPASSTLEEAARAMRDHDVGSVLVMDGDRVRGIATDRDLAVRGLAEGRDPRQTRLGEICSDRLVSVSPNEPVERAVELVRRYAVRRLPVIDDGRPVGIVSLGDLAVERDPASALAEISAAQPNR
jgi:CBS domain-containing protein